MNKKIYIIIIICAFVLTFILLYYVLFYKKEHNTNSTVTKIEQSGTPIYKKVDFEVKFDNIQNLTDVKKDDDIKRN